jgi:hypothetical protein
MTDKTFNPTRRELAEVRRLAHECEVGARVTQQLGKWYGMHRTQEYAHSAFGLAAKVADRGAK